ncbi:unnamed protein product [Trifolium pratense]|uniref:Uncharacterized protein n=1 Tax=Trifolium pratense TaxID=57577 RepID=A0ACB0LVV6_TRIPR|nr:unnamed protein product [Trifolium pratense]
MSYYLSQLPYQDPLQILEADIQQATAIPRARGINSSGFTSGAQNSIGDCLRNVISNSSLEIAVVTHVVWCCLIHFSKA